MLNLIKKMLEKLQITQLLVDHNLPHSDQFSLKEDNSDIVDQG